MVPLAMGVGLIESNEECDVYSSSARHCWRLAAEFLGRGAHGARRIAKNYKPSAPLGGIVD
jgi:hypothetical protein